MDLAERLSKTLEELRTGRPAPMSNLEFEYWKVKRARELQIAEVEPGLG